MHRSTKKYDHNLGFSCAFRQWRATHSHCRYLHGYALAFTFVFESETLDERNWCVDFGGLDSLKSRLKHQFDHTTLVADDDPLLTVFQLLHSSDALSLRIMPKVGCEAFAQMAYAMAQQSLHDMKADHARVVSAEVSEHGANSAIYIAARFGDYR